MLVIVTVGNQRKKWVAFWDFTGIRAANGVELLVGKDAQIRHIRAGVQSVT